MIDQICVVMMRLVHETRHIFEHIFSTTAHGITKLGQLIDISKGNNFQESYEQFGELRLNSRSFFNLATCSNYSLTIYVKIPVFHAFEKVNKGQLKNGKCQLLKYPDLALLYFL